MCPRDPLIHNAVRPCAWAAANRGATRRGYEGGNGENRGDHDPAEARHGEPHPAMHIVSPNGAALQEGRHADIIGAAKVRIRARATRLAMARYYTGVG